MQRAKMTQKNKTAAISHDAMIIEWMKDPAFKTEYDALEEDFALFDELINYIKRKNKCIQESKA
jgi:hypothetical protein